MELLCSMMPTTSECLHAPTTMSLMLLLPFRSHYRQIVKGFFSGWVVSENTPMFKHNVLDVVGLGGVRGVQLIMCDLSLSAG